MSKPKILVFDIENAPNRAWAWALYTELLSEEMIDRPWYMMCWCAKWLGEKEIFSSSLIDFPKNFKRDSEDDSLILKPLWKLMDDADIIVGHNVKRFDIRKAKARFLMNDMLPPSPAKVVDTLTEARKHFYFTSNKLNDLGKYLKVGEKKDTGGFKLWKKCMEGDKAAWNKMVSYCKGDVRLTEKIYYKMLPYMDQHPNLNVYDKKKNTKACCPKCSSFDIEKRGYTYTNVSKYQRYACKSCGGWFRGTENLRKD